MRTVVRALAALGGLLVIGVALAGPAGAHAVLVSSDPENGSRVENPPQQVVLRFTEDVSLRDDGVQLLDGDGEVVETEPGQAEGSTITLAMPRDLAQGTYVVSYRIISADGHPVSGAVVFGYGVDPAENAATTAAAATDDSGWGTIAALARFLSYAGALLAAGGAAFVAFVADPELSRRAGRRLVYGSAALSVAMLPVLVAAQAGQVTGDGLSVVTDGDAMSEALGHGLGWQVGLLVVSAVTAVVAARRPGRGAPGLAAVSVGAAAVAFPLWGHSRAADPSWLAMVGDTLHLAAAGLWFGGLVLLAASLLAATDGLGAAGRTVRAFSRMATGLIVVVALGGVALAVAEVGSAGELVDSDYGRLLLVKVALVAVAVLLGALNRWRLLPAGSWTHLQRSVALEVGLLVMVIGATSVLVDVTPPVNEADGSALVGGEFSAQFPVADTTLTVEILPGRPGNNEMHLTYVRDGGLADIAESVSLELRLPEQDLGPIELDTFELTGGHFVYSGTDMAIPGEWEITVVTRLSRFEEERTAFTVPIA